MSFVLTVCGNNFSLTMGDGRLIRLKDKQVIDEKIQKVYKVKDGVCLGFAGNPVVAEIALNKMQQYNLKKLDPKKIKQLYIDKLKSIGHIEENEVKAIISGKDKNNKFSCYGIDSNNNYDGYSFDNIPRNGYAVLFACSNENIAQPIVQKHIYDTQPWEQLIF